MIYITDGENIAPCLGPVPAGHWESSKDAYDRRMLELESQIDRIRYEFLTERNELVRSARAKLVAGEPLTPEEAALIVM